MTSSPSEPVQMGPVAAEERAAALALVFSWEAEATRPQRIESVIQAGLSDNRFFEHLIEARRGGVRVAAAWAHVVPGRVANVWPACAVPGEAESVEDALQTSLDQRLASIDVVCGQSILSRQAIRPAACLRRNGYEFIADLLFLACDRQQFPTQPPASELQFEPYHLDQRPRLAKLIGETYIDSLDAPALDEVRSLDDVIDGYEGTGNFSPDRWFFVRHQNRDVGCLVLADHSLRGPWELIYMGLIPAVRGRGWGTEIAQFALWLARLAGKECVVLGVDESNHAAIATYARCGFHEVDRRIVWLRKYR